MSDPSSQSRSRTKPEYTPDTPSKQVIDALAGHRRRSVLSVLSSRSRPIPEPDLALEVTARERGKPMVEVTDDEHRQVHASLRHRDLPKLVAAGLIERDDDRDTVSITNHAVLDDPRIRSALDPAADSAPSWDALTAMLANDRRRHTIAVLNDRRETMAVDELASAVANRERQAADGDHPDDQTEPTHVALVHVDLPKLAEVGLVDYDADERTVRYDGGLPTEWSTFVADDAPRDDAVRHDVEDDIRAIQGHENTLELGRSLFERAEEELFIMVTTEGLLEDGCLTRLQDAVDRGVDVYLGSQTKAVRDVVRERVPGAVIWEPQFDWLNLPPQRETIGRLVFADRSAIMLATLGEKDASGVHREAAITGAGENNALVVLMREMLGSRLDHLDRQSEDFLDEVPL